jgi:hypothetical protein
MSIVYTADVFCDGDDCSQWTHGSTGAKPPLKWRTRMQARSDHWVHVSGKDYCPKCAKARGLLPAKEKA